MDNIEIVEFVSYGETSEHVIIDRGNGEYTSMYKTTYDEQQAQAEHFTPMVTDDPKP